MLKTIRGAYVVRKGVSAPYSTEYLGGIGYDEDIFYFRKDEDYNSTASPSDIEDGDFVFSDVTNLTSADIGNVDFEGSSNLNNGIWTSSNNTIATVDKNGIVTAISKGTASITATTEDGQKTDTSTITVLAPEDSIIGVIGIVVNPEEFSLQIEEKVQLIAEISPSNATNQGYIWSSSDTSIATVSNSGLVTAVAEGTVSIIATTTEGNFTGESNITVTVDKVEIVLYPNPSKDTLKIIKAQGAVVEVYTLNGALMNT